MIRCLLSAWIIISFLFSMAVPVQKSAADEYLGLPQPGTMVNLSPAYTPVLIKGLKIHPENPLLFDFIIDTGRSGYASDNPQLRQESEKLIKYFLATLTIPENDLWVNLSPYEKNRIIPDQLGKTELGREMLAQDYILKQLTATLIYPEKGLGKEFWDRVYAKSEQMFGTSQIPVNTFNKVWILPDKAGVFVRNNTAYVVEAHLKVMLEEDYLALTKHAIQPPNLPEMGKPIKKTIPPPGGLNTLGSQIVREIILPELKKEVNQGKNFAPLRQVFYSIILASWYKRNLKEALLNQVYSNKDKINGIENQDTAIKEKIYQQYLKAYKKGVFNYIKDDIDRLSNQPVSRKYFSGGLKWGATPGVSPAMYVNLTPKFMAALSSDGHLMNVSAAMTATAASSINESTSLAMTANAINNTAERNVTMPFDTKRERWASGTILGWTVSPANGPSKRRKLGIVWRGGLADFNDATYLVEVSNFHDRIFEILDTPTVHENVEQLFFGKDGARKASEYLAQLINASVAPADFKKYWDGITRTQIKVVGIVATRASQGKAALIFVKRFDPNEESVEEIIEQKEWHTGVHIKSWAIWKLKHDKNSYVLGLMPQESHDGTLIFPPCHLVVIDGTLEQVSDILQVLSEDPEVSSEVPKLLWAGHYKVIDGLRDYLVDKVAEITKQILVSSAMTASAASPAMAAAAQQVKVMPVQAYTTTVMTTGEPFEHPLDQLDDADRRVLFGVKNRFPQRSEILSDEEIKRRLTEEFPLGESLNQPNYILKERLQKMLGHVVFIYAIHQKNFYLAEDIADMHIAKRIFNFFIHQREYYLFEDYSGGLILARFNDPAMTAGHLMRMSRRGSSFNGGIDFNARNLNVSTSGQTADIHFDKAAIVQFERGDFSGVHAQILSITPLPSVFLLFGMNKPEDEVKPARA